VTDRRRRPGESCGVELAANDVMVERVTLAVPDRERAELETLLSDDERRRVERYRFAVDRERFLVARARLRLVLARHAAGSAARLRFAYGTHGKPWVPSHPRLRFNLAHAGDLALIAVARGREVGVDLERVTAGRYLDDVAETFFSSVEQDGLARLEGETRTRALQRCWCRKEAYVKARGTGLSLPLHTFDVVTDASASPDGSLLLATRPHAAEAGAWDLRDLDVGAAYVAALAVEGRLGRVWSCEPDPVRGPTASVLCNARCSRG